MPDLLPFEVIAASRQLLAEAEAESDSYSVEFAAITGSHSWALATEESDIDVRGVFGRPLRQILALQQILYPDTWQGSCGPLDWQLYEVAKTLRMLCAANGNVVQMFYNPLVVRCTEWGERLRELAKLCLTKRLARYFLGYATSQRKRAMRNRGGKALVYTYREMYAGIYLMAEGEIIFDFGELSDIVWVRWFKSNVLPWATAHRDTPMPFDIEGEFEAEWLSLQEIMLREVVHSSLPAREPEDFEAQCNSLLLDYRLERDDLREVGKLVRGMANDTGLGWEDGLYYVLRCHWPEVGQLEWYRVEGGAYSANPINVLQTIQRKKLGD